MIFEAYANVDCFVDEDERLAWYKKSILFDSNYWSSHKVHHTIDVMHTEKNIAEHLISFTFDKGKQSSEYAWDKIHKLQCCQVLKNAKLLSCLLTKLHDLICFQPPSLQIKKTYDYHIITKYLLYHGSICISKVS